MKECFHFVLKSTFATRVTPREVSELTFDEHNALRYVAGFVPRCITKKKISKGSHAYKESYLHCLSQMGLKGEEDDTGENTFQEFTKEMVTNQPGRSIFL